MWPDIWAGSTRGWRAGRRGGYICPMTTRLALILFLIIAVAIGLDRMFYDQAGLVFLARRGLDLIQWMAFWR